MAGRAEALNPDRIAALQPSLAELSTGMLAVIGWSELLGGVGLIHARHTGGLPWLKPLAALGFVLVTFLAPRSTSDVESWDATSISTVKTPRSCWGSPCGGVRTIVHPAMIGRDRRARGGEETCWVTREP
jgi:hypothetical protein